MNPNEKQKLNQAMTLLEDWFVQHENEENPDSGLVAKAYNLLTELNSNIEILKEPDSESSDDEGLKEYQRGGLAHPHEFIKKK